MKKLQAKDNCTFVSKDKSQIYGKVIYAPDSFRDYMEVDDSEVEEIRKAIESRIQEEMAGR